MVFHPENLIPESQITRPTELCPRPDLWKSPKSPNSMASEIEVGDFMFGLVRLLKPAIVVETGCHDGTTSFKIAEAVKANGYGSFLTCDLEEHYVANLREEAARRELAIDVFCMRGHQLIQRCSSIDLAFIDSGGLREVEVMLTLTKMKRFGVIVLHDTAPHQTEGGIPKRIQAPSMYLNTPRGLTLFSASG
jgi:predicted O-methyltransferase YrrM